MSTHDTLLNEIEVFLAKHGMAPSRFGALSIGDARLVTDLHRGRDLKASTLDRVRRFMAEYIDEGQPRRGRPPLAVNSAA